MPIFDGIVWNNFGAVVAPRAINGTAVIVDLTTPVDHINPIAKLVLDAEDNVDLAASIAYNLAWANNNPEDVGNDDLSDDTLEAAAPWIGANIIRHQTHEILANIGFRPAVRASDIIRVNVLDDALHGNMDYYMNQSARVWGYLSTNAEAMDSITSNRVLAMRSIMANALHRDSEEKHNWFTNRASVAGTSTNKYLAVGGSLKEEFTLFMARYGHDFWHYWNDDTIYSVAYIFSGSAVLQNIENAPGGHGLEANADGTIEGFRPDKNGVMVNHNAAMRVVNLTYGGILNNNVRVVDLVDLGQAAVDRWPPGTLGISALIVGVNMVIAMIDNICAKVSIGTQDAYVNSLEELANVMKEAEFSRSAVMALKAGLEGIIITAYGYCVEIPELEPKAKSFASLVNFAKRNVTIEARGATLARRIREATVDPNAVENIIKAVFGMIRAAVVSIGANANLVRTAIADVSVPYPVGSFALYRNADQIANEDARRRAQAAMAALNPDDDPDEE